MIDPSDAAIEGTPVVLFLAEKQQWLDGLREALSFFEAHPTLIPHYDGASWDLFAYTPEEFSEKCRELGTGEKDKVGRWTVLRKTFGPHRLDVSIASETFCETVQVGTERVVEQMLRDEVPEDAEIVGEVEMVEVLVTKPVFETRCPESFLAG